MMDHENLAKGRPVAILGGGPSLPAHLEIIKQDYPDAVLMGINHHASRLIDCDYIFFNDEHTGEYVKDLLGVKIGRWPDLCDIVIRDIVPGGLSACRAVLVAREMGASQILLAGMDCSGKYFDDYPINKRANNQKMHFQYWAAIDRSDVVVLGGPLVDYFAGLDAPDTTDTIEIEITEARVVPTDNFGAIHFVPGLQKLTHIKAKAARKAGIVKET